MLDIDIHQIEHLYYHQKKSASEIAEIFGCSPPAIYKRMKQNGMQRRSLSEAHKLRYSQKRLNLDLAEVVRLYFEEYLSLAAVGERLGVSYCTVRRRLITAGYVPRKRGEERHPRKSPFTNTDLAEMVRLYCEAEWSSAEIASRYNCCDATIRVHLKQQGVQLRTFKEAQALRRKKEIEQKSVGAALVAAPLPPEQVTPERILQLRHEENLTIDAIAGRSSLSNLEVFNILQEAEGR